MSLRTALRALLMATLYPGLLFGSAGTLRWVEGWVFLALQAALSGYLMYWLGRHDPALRAERLRGGFHPDQPRWDRVLVSWFALAWLLWLCVPGLDAVRYGPSGVLLGAQLAGGALHLLGWWGLFAVHRANTFLAPVVRIQRERGQRVIDTGPYAVVRHPMYAAFFAWIPGAGLLLGSWWAVALAPAVILPLVVRTWFEDECLARELPGYAAYRTRVRYRLLPGVW